MSRSDQPEGRGTIVKDGLLTVFPFTVTEKGPDRAPDGTIAFMFVSLQFVNAAVVPFSEIVLLPCGVPNPVPEIKTTDPTGPEVGDMPLMVRLSVTVKVDPLLYIPLANTTTSPVIAPAGTVATMLIADHDVTVAFVPLNVTVPPFCAAPKFVPVIVMDVPTGPEVGDRLTMLGGCNTVKLAPLLATPPTVTTTLPLVAVGGTIAVIDVGVQFRIFVANGPLKETVLVPCGIPKFVPVIVTVAPTTPELGARPVMLSVDVDGTVKLIPLLASPFTVTTTFPVVAPAGTGTLIDLWSHLVGVPGVPLKVTVLLPWDQPKFFPLIVTETPAAPEVGVRLVMQGVCRTVNLTRLLSTPFTLTTTWPVLAPSGTGTWIESSLQMVGADVIQSNNTVLAPCVLPKFVPAIVTISPTSPELGVRPAMWGVGRTVKLIPLLATPFTVTTTLPVVAPAGTGTLIDLLSQLVGAPGVPLKVTVFLPWDQPKSVPLIVTHTPTAPVVSDRLVIVGAAA